MRKGVRGFHNEKVFLLFLVVVKEEEKRVRFFLLLFVAMTCNRSWEGA